MREENRDRARLRRVLGVEWREVRHRPTAVLEQMEKCDDSARRLILRGIRKKKETKK
jgi:hypothetical protein